MSFRTLISTSALASRLEDPSYVVVDCRFKLDDVSWGERAYRGAHVPGAVYAHLDRDLSGPRTGRNGRHPLPDPRVLADTLGGFGIASGVQVVAYDQDNGMFASRLWWMLRWLGHEAVAVLDGGFAKWTAEGRETRSGTETRPSKPFEGQPRGEMVADAAAVAAAVTSGVTGATMLLDARAPERYRGDSEPLDPVAGHIPGARNYFFQQNIGEQGTFRVPEELRDRLRRPLGAVAPADLICYCGSGVTACHNLLALEHAGLPGARLYPGSWSEWCADDRNPVETG
jgi:thiosulfate/3-mercaptopyruvate sulfurtransferase